MYIDEQLTINMQGWLNTEPAKRDLMKGAEMVLKLTRNRILYQNISTIRRSLRVRLNMS